MYFIEAGLVLLFVPWLGLWDHNYFVTSGPHLRAFLGNPFLRGAVSGLGVVNLMAGAAELVAIFHHRRV